MTRQSSDRRRVVIEHVNPEINGGRFPIKRISGEEVTVTADIFADGHDALAAVLCYRAVTEGTWHDVPMVKLENDRWSGSFSVQGLGRYEYMVQGWVDTFASWRNGLRKKVDAGLTVASEILEGALLVRQAAARAAAEDAQWLQEQAARLERGAQLQETAPIALAPELQAMMARYPDRTNATSSEPVLNAVVERERAGFSSWYEMFPRSAATEPGRHGTFKDCEARLPYVASMGFDVLYLPPIHPIGHTHRKGRQNSPTAAPDDPGSPWAIGSEEGGHTAVHPALGTLADFDRLVERARDFGIEIALDLAFQCSPDHPWVREHPEWFRRRPDGSIQYAENPPKKYEDIFPLNFEGPDSQALWDELKAVVLFWTRRGVRIFRVDNPHTKPFRFWEWLIGEVRREYPDTIYLAEAFTRPTVMRYLAKCGFSQSYTYFTWRNTKTELTDYFTELTRTEVREYMRPNLFANTPDILHEYLQYGGRPAFQIRLVLAATLGPSYGIYGPAFELCETRAVPGTEEYAESEKYQMRHWTLDQPGSLREFIARVNDIRRTNPALHDNHGLRFFPTDNDQLLCFGKGSADRSNIILVVVNLDPHHLQSGSLDVAPEDFGLDATQPYQVHDLLGDARFFWYGRRHTVSLDPHVLPAYIFRVRRRLRTERDFDYFM